MADISITPLSDLGFKDKAILWIIVFGLMATSGLPLFLNSNSMVVGLFIICLLAGVYYKIRVTKYLLYILIFCLILLFQTVFFGIGLYGKTAGLQMILFLTGMLGAAVVGINFTSIFTKLMLFFSIMSLILFIPMYIYLPFYDTLVQHFPIKYSLSSDTAYGDATIYPGIFFLNFPDLLEERVRNSGPFWEPGAFGGFLIVCFMLNTIKTKALISWQNIILIVTIISTFSTTAYIALFVFVAGYYTLSIKNVMNRFMLVAVLIGSFVFIYNALAFLSPKIQAEFENTDEEIELRGGNGRVASAYLDMKEFGEENFYYFAGRGSHPETRYGGNFKSVIRTNGVTDQLVRWGIPFFLFYLFCVRKTFRNMCDVYEVERNLSYLALIVLLILATSEVYFCFSFFWMLFFLHIPYKEYLKNYNNLA